MSLLFLLSSVSVVRCLVFADTTIAIAPYNVSRSYHAFVISWKDERWNATSSLLRECGLNPSRIWPVALNVAKAKLQQITVADWSSVHARAYRIMSATLSHEKAAQAIAEHPDIPDDGFGFVFEDDAALNGNISLSTVLPVLLAAAHASLDTGFMYLGICEPGAWISPFHSASFMGVVIRRAVGHCVHAYGLAKARARTFWSSGLQVQTKYCQTHACDVAFFAAPDRIAFTLLSQLPLHQRPLLLGANLRIYGATVDDRQDHGTGMFYQANSAFPTDMWSNKPGLV